MFSTEFLLKLLNKEKASRYLYIILFISLLTVSDFFTLYIFSNMISIYLYMTIIMLVSILGLFLVVNIIKNIITEIEKKHDNRIYPEVEFYRITAMFFASIFIIFPGIISSIIGFILILPYFRQLIGRLLCNKLNLDWYAAYEYKEIYKI